MNCLLLLLAQTVLGQKKIFDTDAKNHVGETLEVAGRVSNFEVSKHGHKTLLYCGINYPN
jgi:hypothetical protein